MDVELPGVKQTDIDIEINGRELAMTGELEEKERAGILRERTRRVGEFRFAITLPGDLDADAVDARLEDGALHITAARVQRAKPRHISSST